jgi:hypothetical protein
MGHENLFSNLSLRLLSSVFHLVFWCFVPLCGRKRQAVLAKQNWCWSDFDLWTVFVATEKPITWRKRDILLAVSELRNSNSIARALKECTIKTQPLNRFLPLFHPWIREKVFLFIFLYFLSWFRVSLKTSEIILRV